METTPGRLERPPAPQAKVFIGGTCLVGLRLGSLDLNEPKAFIAAGILLWRSARVGQVPRPVLVNQDVAARFEEKRRLPFW